MLPQQEKCSALNAGQQLLNTVCCLIPFEVVEEVAARVCAGNED